MVVELEKAGVTELQVRMDCNGCVRRIKKAMHDIDGVYDFYIDFAQQKVTVIGRAEPDKIVAAIRRRRKTAIVCSHTEPGKPDGSDPPPATEKPAPEAPGNQPSGEKPQAPEEKQLPEAKQPAPGLPKAVEEIHMVHHYYPYSYLYKENWDSYPLSGQDEVPRFIARRYNRYRQWRLLGRRFDRGEADDGDQIDSMFSDENPNACCVA